MNQINVLFDNARNYLKLTVSKVFCFKCVIKHTVELLQFNSLIKKQLKNITKKASLKWLSNSLRNTT